MSMPAQETIASRVDWRGALRGAAIAALLMLGLSFPILAYRADANFSNELVLRSRWFAVCVAVAIIFILRFLTLIFARRARAPAPVRKYPPRLVAAFMKRARLVSRTGIALLIAFPFIALYAAGPAGSLKWIDNYGIQILLYVMLGWGLNIVVGLAGLLDLGYVAFYAVGAYTYALLATTWGWFFWSSLPIAGLLAALWGILLGFPVLRLRGDYLAIVTLAFGEIIRIVLVNWTALTNGDAGIGSIPRITFFGRPFIAGPDGFAALLGLKYAPVHRVIFLYFVVLALALATNFVSMRLRRLPGARGKPCGRMKSPAVRLASTRSPQSLPLSRSGRLSPVSQEPFSRHGKILFRRQVSPSWNRRRFSRSWSWAARAPN